jgi:hypothetical protein
MGFNRGFSMPALSTSSQFTNPRLLNKQNVETFPITQS